ncbi:MAG: ABC transporter permease [Opitutales bacterium]
MTETTTSRGLRRFTEQGLQIGGPLLGLALVIFLFSLDGEVRDRFLTPVNFRNILTQTVIVALGALGMVLIIVSGGIDLSVGSVIAFTSVVGAVLIQQELAVPVVLIGSLAAGGLMGLLNGTIIAKFGLQPFIVTLGMMGVARGLAKWLAGNQTVDATGSPLNTLMAVSHPLSPVPPTGVWITLGLAVLVGLVLVRTVFGRNTFALGSNEATARLCGIRVSRLKILIYLVAGLFYGLAGLMQLARLNQGDPTTAVGLELDVIAAVVIGGASLSGGVGSVTGAMLGALIMSTLRNGALMMGWPDFMQDIIIGLVIVLAVGIDQWRQTRLKRG